MVQVSKKSSILIFPSPYIDINVYFSKTGASQKFIFRMRNTLIYSRDGKGQLKGITTSSHWQTSQTETWGKSFQVEGKPLSQMG